MSITRKEAINFFNFLEKSSKHDSKITIEDLKIALAVDSDNDGKITDISFNRVIFEGTDKEQIIVMNEQNALIRNINEWTSNAGDKWSNDNAIDLNEFLEMMNV